MGLDDLTTQQRQAQPFLQGRVNRISGEDVYAVPLGDFSSEYEFGPCGYSPIPGSPPEIGDLCLIYAPEIGGMPGMAWIISYQPQVAPIMADGFKTGDLKNSLQGAPDATWFACDGSEHAIDADPDLAAICGTTFGALTNGSGGAGTSHFRVPDFRDRALYGVGTLALGASDGRAQPNRGPAHVLSTAEIPAHTHPLGPSGNPQTFTPAGAGAFIAASTGGAGTGLNPGTAQNAGGGGAHDHGYGMAFIYVKR